MSGEPGTEPDLTEIENLQHKLNDTELDLETSQNDLDEMTQMRDALANALQDAVAELDDIYDKINTTNYRAVLNQNS